MNPDSRGDAQSKAGSPRSPRSSDSSLWQPGVICWWVAN
jgi:hypothetical protein